MPDAKTPGSNKNKVLALPAPGDSNNRLRGQRNSSMRQQSNKDFRISSSKKSAHQKQITGTAKSQEEEINNKLKKQQIITMLLKIQNLRQDDVNNAMRDMLLSAQKQYKD